MKLNVAGELQMGLAGRFNNPNNSHAELILLHWGRCPDDSQPLLSVLCLFQGGLVVPLSRVIIMPRVRAKESS
jgi:hypothetical protein